MWLLFIFENGVILKFWEFMSFKKNFKLMIVLNEKGLCMNKFFC